MFQPTTILHPTDFSDAAVAAFRHAAHLARQHDAALHVIHVSTHLGGDPIRDAYDAQVDTEGFRKAIRAAEKAEMRALLGDVDLEGIAVTRVYEDGVAPAPIILEYAAAHDVDLMVMGTHGRRGMKRFMLGSVAEEVVRHAACSVLTVRGEDDRGPDTIDRVLAPVDLAEMTEPLLHTSHEVAQSFDAQLDILHVVEPLPFPVPLLGGVTLHDLLPDPEDRARKQLSTLANALVDDNGPIKTHVTEGHADMAILQAADELDTDLIVIASHDMSRLEQVLLGSVTARVMRRAACPVLIVRLPEQQIHATLQDAEAAAEDT